MKKVISLFMTIVMLLSITAGIDFSANAQEEITTVNCIAYLEKIVDIDSFRKTLSSALMQCEESVDISSYKITYNSNTWIAIRNFISYYMPEFFNGYGSCYSYSISNNTFITLKITYYEEYNTPEKFKKAYDEIEAVANKLLSDIKDNDKLSDEEKALLVHDRLAVWTAYDDRYYTNDLPWESYTIYGALVNRRTACQGYALTYLYLMNKIGIKTLYVSSALLNHAWNIVYINGKEYFVDVTWDDPTLDDAGYVRHINFLRSAAGFAETGHDRNGIDYYSELYNTEYDNYYWQNSNSEFQLIDNTIYYLDNTNGTLNIADESKTYLCSVSDKYYAKLSSYNDKLLFCSECKIFQYNLENGIKCEIFTPDISKMGKDFFITGFTCEEGVLYCYTYNNLHSCRLDERDNYLITCKYDSLDIEERHNFVNNVCEKCGLKEFEYSLENNTAAITGYNGYSEDVIIPEKVEGYSVEIIDEKAFYNRDDISAVSIPDSVTTIRNYAFFLCDNLKSITIGNGASSIETYAFYKCSNVEAITVNPDNKVYDSRNNCNAVIESVTNTLICGFKTTVIPVGVTSIGQNAFCNCTGLTSIIIPNSVTSIAWGAFYNCTGLTSIIIPSSVKSIGWYTFYYCTGLADITILNLNCYIYDNEYTIANNASIHGYSNSTAKDYAEKYGRKFVSLGDYCEQFGHNYVNHFCKVCGKKDPNFTVPSISVNETKTVAIDNAEGLYYFEFIPSTSGEYTFYSTGKSNTYGYIYNENKSELLAENNNSGIDYNFSISYNFEKGKKYILACKNLSTDANQSFEVCLKEGRIVYFYDVLNEEEITIIDSIGSASNIEIPSILDGYTVSSISRAAFYNSTSLTSITIPKSVTSIGYAAFYNCTGLADITILNPNCHIYDDEYTIANNASIHGYSNSTAKDYAEKYGRKFVSLGDYCEQFGHDYVNRFCTICGEKDPNYTTPSISVNETKTINIQIMGDMQYIEFTPAEDGKYVFYSTGDFDTYGYLYDTDMNELTKNDDGGEGSNFSITYDLQAERTYIFACRMYYSYNIGTFNVTLEFEKEEHIHSYIERTVEPTCTQRGYTTYTCECGDNYVDDYVPATGHSFEENLASCTVCGVANPNYVAPQPTTPTEPTQPTPTAPTQPSAPAQSTTPTQPVATAPTAKEKAPSGAAKVNGEWAANKQKNAKIKKLTGAKKSFKATWSKVSGVTGYQIQYSTSSKFTKKTTKSVTINKNKTTSATVKKLKAKKKYYVRVRTYKNVKLNGKTVKVYSSWTKAKTVKTK